MRLDLTRFRDFAPIGRGAVVDVHSANADFDGSAVDVCVKRIRAGQGVSFATRMFDAAHRASLVRSPHVVRMFAYGATDHGYAFVVERVRGPSLRAILEACALRGERVPVDVAFHLAHEVARGLSAGLSIASHGPVLTHRGVSPAAVRVADDGRVVLSEFSMGSMFPLDEELRLRMSAGLGHYLSPEHFIPQGVEPTADVYSLGALLYEMLSGHRPRRTPIHQSLPDGTARHLAKHRPDLPREVTNLVEACLNLNRSARVASANDFARALAQRGFRSIAPAAVSAYRASVLGATHSSGAPRAETMFHGGAATVGRKAPVSEAPGPGSVPPATMLFGGIGAVPKPIARPAPSPPTVEAAAPPPVVRTAASPWAEVPLAPPVARTAVSPWAEGPLAQPVAPAAPSPWAMEGALAPKWEAASTPVLAVVPPSGVVTRPSPNAPSNAPAPAVAMQVSDGQTAFFVETVPAPPAPSFVAAPAFGARERATPRFGVAYPAAEAPPVANRSTPAARRSRELPMGWVFALAVVTGFALVIAASIVLRIGR